MKIIVTIYLICILFLGCQKEPSDASVENINSTSLKLLFEYSIAVPEPSGLTYNSKNNSLFTVSDNNSTVYEIDFWGKILRSFRVDNVDLEGIAFCQNCDTIYVVDEANQTVGKYSANGLKLSSFSVNVATDDNNSLEGITVDSNNNLFVINEKSPCMVIEFKQEKEINRRELNYTTDCSDICYDKSLDCFWLISDESQLVVKLSRTGQLLAKYSIPFTKGEGITIVNERIYVVNDDNNKLYVFQKP